jgi:hypothetical protein
MVKGNLVIKPLNAELIKGITNFLWLDTEFMGKMDPFVIIKYDNQ